MAQGQIVIEGVSHRYCPPSGRPVLALEEVSLEVGTREFVALLGPSGCGKSTLLYLIGGFLPTEIGNILIEGKPVGAPGPDRGIVFQHFALFPWKTVRGNVLYGLERMRLARAEREKRAQSYIDLVGLTGFEDSYPSQLSGGMKQRTGLVSTLALPPLSAVAAAWIELLKDGELISNGVASLWRAGAGLFLAIALGAVLGIFMAWWRPAYVTLSPLVEMFYPMPKSALIPVTVLWLGFGNGSKILLILLGCMLPVTIGAFNGARSSEQALVWSARSMGANRLRMLWDVVVPSAMPELLNGIRTALALSFIRLVSSELIAAREGLGYLIGFLGATGSYEAMFAVVLTVAFIGFLADRAYQAVVERALRWRE